jgi:hypothetical protein
MPSLEVPCGNVDCRPVVSAAGMCYHQSVFRIVVREPTVLRPKGFRTAENGDWRRLPLQELHFPEEI